MADRLFPAFDVPDIEEDEEYDSEYKKSVKWNPESGDFVRDGSNNMVECDGMEAYMIWCYKMVQTERYCHMAYLEGTAGTELGVEIEEALQESDHKVTESMITRTITDALMVNPRTEYVRNFTYSWEGDELHFTFEVKGIDWDETIQISL